MRRIDKKTGGQKVDQDSLVEPGLGGGGSLEASPVEATGSPHLPEQPSLDVALRPALDIFLQPPSHS